MKLAEYLSDNGLTQTAFAAKIEAAQVEISRFATGDRLPPWHKMLKIYKATKGAVTPNDFLPEGHE